MRGLSNQLNHLNIEGSGELLMKVNQLIRLLIVPAMFFAFHNLDSTANQFTSSFLYDANTWPGSDVDVGIYGQGFTPDLDALPDPGLTDTDLVGLDRFTFFKDGYVDSASNVKLAIVNNFYANIAALTTSSPEFVGLSTNTLASTGSLSVGDAYSFDFSSLQLEYGADYGAIFVNDDGLGNLTPVKVSALTADYVETSPGSGIYAPTANYGTNTDFQYGTSSFINSTIGGDFLAGFSDAGDAKFEAVFDLDPGLGDFEFNNSFSENTNTWSGTTLDPGIYGQGFRPSLDPSQLGHLADDTVGLDQFSFYKDGNTDGQTDIKLVIVDDMFMDLEGLTTTSSGVVGVSTNTLSSTAGLSEGDKYTFDFDSLQLDYIEDYAAIFVNDDGSGNLTPIKVSALSVDYVETSPGSGVFVPASNYGEESDSEFAASTTLDMPGVGSFLVAQDGGGDARFEAVYDIATTTVPEDLNGDGFVDGLDLGILLGNWNQTTIPANGELNGVPPVDGLDLGILLGAWNPAPSNAVSTSIPEPDSILCLAICSLLAQFRRRVI